MRAMLACEARSVIYMFVPCLVLGKIYNPLSVPGERVLFTAQADRLGGSGPRWSGLGGRPQRHPDAVGEDSPDQLCRGFVKHRSLRPTQIFQSIRTRAALRICISNKSPDATDATGLGARL